MRIPMEDLLKMEDEIIYDYLGEHRQYYTKNELKILAEAKKVYFSTSDTNDDIRKSILHKIAKDKVNNFLSPEKEYGYINLNKVKEFSPLEKIRFIEDYGKYLGTQELRSLIYEETKSYPPTYDEILKGIFLKTQKELIKEF
jgi:hypothetical protein